MTKTRARPVTETLPNVAIVPEPLVTRVPAAREALRGMLLTLKLTQLRALGAARRVPGRSGQREPLANTLLDHLLDPAGQAEVVGALDALARAVLATAVVLDTPRTGLAPEDFARVVPKYAREVRSVEQAVTELTDLGLLFPASDLPVYHAARYRLPPALAPALLPLLPEIGAYNGDLPAEPGGGATAERGLETAPALRKIGALLAALQAADYTLAEPGPREYRGQPIWSLGGWDLVGDMPAPRPRGALDDRPVGIQVATGRPLLPPADLARLRAAAGLSRDEEAAFFIHLLEALHLLGRAGQALVVQQTNVETFTALPAQDRLQQVVAAWRGLNQWSEVELLLADDPALGLFRSSALQYADPTHLHGDVARLRQALELVFAWLPVGPWYDLGMLLTCVHRLFPELPVGLQPQGTGWEQAIWWFERADAGGWHYLNRRNAPDWLRGLARLLTTVIAGPLSWLGLAEVTPGDGKSRAGAFPGSGAGFRLTTLGGVALSRRPGPLRTVQPLPAGAALQPANGPAVVFEAASGPAPALAFDPRTVPLDDQIVLAGLAEPVLADPGFCLYRLTPAAARRGFDTGLTPEAIEETLRRLAGDVPAPLRRRLREWWATYGRLRFYTGVTLLRFGDDFTLPELLASTGLGNVLLYQFSPRLVVVPSAAVDRLLSELARAGHTPRVVDESRPAGAGTPGGP